MLWQRGNLSRILFAMGVVLLTCLSGAVRAQDCTSAGGGYDSHGNYDDAVYADARENAAFKEDIKKAKIGAVYNDLWEDGDLRILIKTWPHTGLRLFHSMLLQKAAANNNALQVRELLRRGVYLNLATAQVAQDQVSLFMALGGGWQGAPAVDETSLQSVTK